MSQFTKVCWIALITLALGACGKSAPTPAAAGSTKAAPSGAKQAPEAGASSATQAKSVEALSPAKAAAGVRGSAPVVGDKPAKADESDMVPEAEAKPQVTKEECDKACAHATKLSMASMPPDATPDMKAAIEKALTESCPKDCMAKGTKRLVECIMNAKSGMELAANCQK